MYLQVGSSWAVGVDGTFYVSTNQGILFALTPAGELKWHLMTAG